ncbi:hypothetical protein V2V90_24125 (plasmid) [Agrobacterium leguminum]|uniref:hypothetical protein n=1 Tax=Agrobacterium leguminum TaxID=2792015 RepID=UPI0030D0B863
MITNRRKQLAVRAAGAALSIITLVAIAAPASAENALSGVWTGEDDLEINFDKRSVDLGPDTGCTIQSLKAEGANRWRMRLSCGTADTAGTSKADTTLQLKGSTLIFTDKYGPNQLKRQGR